jgi:hypothetical protein
VGISESSGVGNVDTLMTLSGGRVNVTGASTAPASDFDLANKKYVDDNVVDLNGPVDVNGLLTCHEGLTVVADTGNTFDGVVVQYLGVDRASFFFNESDGSVGISQVDSFGGLKTSLTIKGGEGFINGTKIQTGVLAAVATVGASGTYLDGSGNTITVVDGLITDLGQ